MSERLRPFFLAAVSILAGLLVGSLPLRLAMFVMLLVPFVGIIWLYYSLEIDDIEEARQTLRSFIWAFVACVVLFFVPEIIGAAKALLLD